MGTEIDRLEIQIDAETEKANKALEQLTDRLEGIGKSLSGITEKKLTGFADGMEKIAKASTGLSKINTSDFTKLAKSIQGVSGANAQKTSDSLKKVSDAFALFTNRVNKSTRSIHSFSQMAGRFYANSFLMIRGVKKAWSSVETSMDFIETVNYFEVAMRKIGEDAASTWNGAGYDSAESYAQSFSDRAKQLTAKMTGWNVDQYGNTNYAGGKSLGMNPDELMKWQAVYAQMTDSLGLAEESTLMFSDALTRLGADWASLRNISFDQSWNKFASALSGQSRAVRSLGIDITNATLQEYAYKFGLDQAIQEMNQATKSQLRLLAILDQSEVAYGDLANTISLPANQLRLLQQHFTDLSRTIGNIFMPVVQAVLPYVNGLVMSVQRLFEWLKNLLGIKNTESNPYGGMSEEMADLVGGAEDFEDALNGADKAAKKLKNNLQSWHEINNITVQDNADAGKVSVGGSAVLDGEIASALERYKEKWDAAFDRMEDKAQMFADKLAAWAQKVYDAISPFREAVISLWDNGLSKLASFTWGAMGNFYNDFLAPIGEWAFGSEDMGITRLVNVINNGLLSIEWDKLTNSLRNFWTAIEPYAEQFGEGLIDFFEKVTGITVDVANGIPGFLDKMAIALNNGDPETARAWGEALPKIAIGIMAFKGIAKIGEHILTLYAVIKKIIASDVFTAFSAGVSSLFGNSAATSALAFLPKIAKLFSGLGSIITGIGIAVKNFIDMFLEGFSWIKEILMVVGIALTAVGAVILGAPAAIAAGVAAIVAAIATVVVVVKEHWAQICDFFAGIGTWINENVIQPVIGFFRELGEKVFGFFQDLWNGISEVWSTVSMWFSENVIEPIVAFFTGLWMRVQQIFEGLWIIVQAVWKVASGWFNEHVIVPVVEFFQSLWEKVSGFFTALWGDIQTIWSTVAAWFNENVITQVVGFFQNVWEKVSGFFSDLWENIKEVWSEVAGWFNEHIITPLKTAFDKVTGAIATAFTAAWDLVKSGVVGAMNAVIGGIETAINWIVDGINKIIGGFNKVVSWAAKIAEVDWGGVDLVPNVVLGRIDMYANGGYPETGQLFMARENGLNEFVGKIGNRSAVADNDDIVEAVAYGVSMANEETNSLLRELISVMRQGNAVEIDGERVFRVVKNNANEFYNRTGISPFPV